MLLDANFILFVLLLFTNFIFCVKRVPLMAWIIAVFTVFIGGITFLNDVNIPANPVTTVMLISVAFISMYFNAKDFRR